MRYYPGSEDRELHFQEDYGTLSLRIKRNDSTHDEYELHFLYLDSIPKADAFLRSIGFKTESNVKSKWNIKYKGKLYKVFFYGDKKTNLKELGLFDDVVGTDLGYRDVKKQFTFEGLPIFIKK